MPLKLGFFVILKFSKCPYNTFVTLGANANELFLVLYGNIQHK